MGTWVALGWRLGLAAAHAAGGALVGPIGQDPPQSDATQVSIAPDIDGNTLVVAIRVAHADGDFAVLWPAKGIVSTSLLTVGTTWFDRIEAATRPRVEQLDCDELVTRDHLHTAPGCSSFEVVREPVLRGEDALASVPAGGEWADTDVLVERIEAADLTDWLALRSFALDPDVALALEPHLAAGEPILTIQPTGPVPDGTWLPPVRFRTDPGDVVLPLSVGDAAGLLPHTLFVYGGAPLATSNPAIVNYPRGYVQDDCMLPASEDAASWIARARDAFEATAALPTYVLEYAGRADTCSPCTDPEPLDLFALTQVGIEVGPDEARLSRLWLEWSPGALDEDPVVSFEGLPPSDVSLRFVATEPELGFAIPFCGTTIAPGALRCPNIREPNGACDASSGGRRSVAAGLLAALLAAGASARRWGGRQVWRSGALVLAIGLLGRGDPARAADRRADPGPRTELAASWSVVGTDRIVPLGLDSGAPWLLNPFVGLEVRRSVWSWRFARSLGLLGGLRGLAGRAAPWSARGVVGFALVEPWVGVDARHGRFREASPCVFGRYGLDVSVATLWPTVSPVQATLSAGVHAGLGWWVGRGTARTAIEARAGLIPRTDAFETTFHPNIGYPGWRFLPGTANLWLVVGRTTY